MNPADQREYSEDEFPDELNDPFDEQIDRLLSEAGSVIQSSDQLRREFSPEPAKPVRSSSGRSRWIRWAPIAISTVTFTLAVIFYMYTPTWNQHPKENHDLVKREEIYELFNDTKRVFTSLADVRISESVIDQIDKGIEKDKQSFLNIQQRFQSMFSIQKNKHAKTS